MSPKKVGIQSFQLSMHDVGASLPSNIAKIHSRCCKFQDLGASLH